VILKHQKYDYDVLLAEDEMGWALGMRGIDYKYIWRFQWKSLRERGHFEDPGE
jgi:hypothetical protein